MTVYTVSFKSIIETDTDIITSSFSTIEKAKEYQEKLKNLFEKLGLSDFQVSIDAVYIDDDATYIEWLDNTFKDV